MTSKFHAFDFYLLRVPRFSYGIIHKINEFKKKEDAWNFIKDLLNDEEILDAIYLASEVFFEELTDVIKADYSPSVDKILDTLYKYVSRMSNRPTPFGKFSGVSLGEILETTNSIELSGEFLASFRLDMGLAAKISQKITENPVKQKQLVYYSNSTLYENGDYFKYIDFNESHDRKHYHWAKVANNPVLKHILHQARNGKKIQELVGALQAIGVGEEKAERYLYQLIEIKLLISELESCVTAYNSNDILSRLKTIQPSDFPISILLDLDRFLKINSTNVKKLKPSEVRKIRKEINLAKDVNIFQADMLVGTKTNRISKRIIEELAKEFAELSVINKAKPTPDLISFRKKFLARYGDRERPLLEAIDPENGIGYGEIVNGTAEENPLIQGLGTLRKKESKDHRSNVIQYVMNKYNQQLIDQKTSIKLEYQDIKAIQEDSNDCSAENLPSSFYLLGNLFLPNSGDDKRSYYFNLLAGGGVSAIPLMTRFAHLDARLEENLQNCVDWDEQNADDIVFGEVVYIPESRVGNILTRPNLFKYEIPIIGQSAVDDDFIISLDDLWVSIKEGKVILRSKRLNKQVIPRLSSAHNFHYGMVIYRFLCDLQFQSNCLDISWEWGLVSKRPFLPRVTYKHIILSRARWHIAKTHFRELCGSDDRSKTLSLKEMFGLPDLILLANGDNELLLDLRSPISCGIMLKELRKRDLVLHECLFDQFASPVCDSAGKRYNNEILIPMRVNQSVKGVKLAATVVESVRRSFHPGSEWVFLKVYCGISESDKVLSEQIVQLKNALVKNELIEKWFFIRYQDPDPHIRLRFLLRTSKGSVPFQLVVDCINEHLEPLLRNNTISRILYDTYERELQRYGGDKIEICESIFHIDSESVLSMLPLYKWGEGNHFRWLTGMMGIDHLLSAFGMNVERRIIFLTSLRDAFLSEFSGDDKLKYKLDCKYRENRSRIQNFFYPPNNSEIVNCQILFDRFDAIRDVIQPIKNADLSDQSFSGILSSLSHMFVNRLFAIKQREHEMIIYHFLIKHYCSIAKRYNAGHPMMNYI